MARGFLRFQRRLKILPGITLNFSKSGISTSVGVRGAHITIGKRNIRRTVGIPGTGLSYTTLSPRKAAVRGGLRLKHLLLIWLALFFYVAVEIPEQPYNQEAIDVLAWLLIAIFAFWPIYRLVMRLRTRGTTQQQT